MNPFKHLAGFLEWGSANCNAVPTHIRRKPRAYVHAPSGIRTHDPNFPAIQDHTRHICDTSERNSHFNIQMAFESRTRNKDNEKSEFSGYLQVMKQSLRNCLFMIKLNLLGVNETQGKIKVSECS
jgi:hypothetical protein